MSTGQQPALTPQPEQQPQAQAVNAQVLPPAPQIPIGSGVSVSQITQVNQHIPPQVWTPVLVDKYMTLLSEESADIRRSMNGFQKREYSLWLIGMVAVIGIVITGLVFMAKGITGGKEIILGALSFAAGLLAGRKIK
jgi:hypothetical protein